MESSLASQNLAIVSYKMATDPNFIEDLARQVEAGVIDGGDTLTEEETAALKILLSQKQSTAQEGTPVTVLMSTWIG